MIMDENEKGKEINIRKEVEEEGEEEKRWR